MIELNFFLPSNRFVSRYILKHYIIDVLAPEKTIEMLKEHMVVIKRVLFSRSLRLLPLPEQVGAVEALAMVVDQLPSLLPLNDQHLLAFLSELLKMSSVADGEMTDPNLIGSVVDKNGYAMPVLDTAQAASKESSVTNDEKASSTLFLRRDSILKFGPIKFFVPGEASNGVQLRASTIRLLRAVIRGHADSFFDADSSTPVGKHSSVKGFLVGDVNAGSYRCAPCIHRQYPPPRHQSAFPLAGFFPSGMCQCRP
jgi:hypothetical protein